MNSRVSILTPSFNQGRWLGDNLASVRCQTYPRIEHIVMDGGSTDETIDVLRSAGSSIRWWSEPDRGQTDALNKALARSSGEIIGWLNSDDAYADCRVVVDVVDFFERHAAVDVVFGHALRVNPEGKIVYVMWVPPFNYRLLRWLCYIVQPSVFMRRSAVAQSFLDETFHFAMDWELWLRLGLSCTFKRINRVLAVDRVQPGRKMKTLLPVLEADRARLGETYGVSMPWFYFPLERAYHVATRLAGASYVYRLPSELAFTGVQDTRQKLLRRQIASRKSRWAEVDR